MGTPRQPLICSLSPHTDGGTASTPGAGPHSGGPGKALAEPGEDRASGVRARAGAAPEEAVILTPPQRSRCLGALPSPPSLPVSSSSARRSPSHRVYRGGLYGHGAAAAPGCCPGAPGRPTRPSRSGPRPAPSRTHPSAPEPRGQPPTAEPPPQPTTGELWGRGADGSCGSWALTV